MELTSMLFQGWAGIIRTLAVGLLSYVCLVIFLRIAGKRTLAKLNAFDLVITVALGSTLSAILLQESVALAEGASALALLILMQFAVTSFSVRSSSFANAVRSEPALLVKDGICCRVTMRRERLTEDEVLSAVRSSGGHRMNDARTVILESDGTLSVSLRTERTGSTAASARPEGESRRRA
jgi:uncharacterized membrane protein YcaP (DUF421 family)